MLAGCVPPPPPGFAVVLCNAVKVNRQRMAVFLLKAKKSSLPSSPARGRRFQDDVTCDNPFAGYIEKPVLVRGYQLGMQRLSGLAHFYCPTDPTKRKQMTTFLVKAFGLVALRQGPTLTSLNAGFWISSRPGCWNLEHTFGLILRRDP